MMSHLTLQCTYVITAHFTWKIEWDFKWLPFFNDNKDAQQSIVFESNFSIFNNINKPLTTLESTYDKTNIL